VINTVILYRITLKLGLNIDVLQTLLYKCTVVKCNFPIHLPKKMVIPVNIRSFFGHLGVPSTQINVVVLIYTAA